MVPLTANAPERSRASRGSWPRSAKLPDPTPDALIAAQAFNRRASLFTVDADFANLGLLVGLKLF
jgi:predicted nucleic acid-binding protein